jgi:hypothetical protein
MLKYHQPFGDDMTAKDRRPTTRSGDDGTPFVSDWTSRVPFDDIKGKKPVDDPVRMLEGWQERRKKESAVFETRVGDWNTVPAALLSLLSRHRRAVARIVVPPGNHLDFMGRRQPGGWTGTGFLVGPNLLLTNHHVLNSPEVAAAASIEFDYELPEDQLVVELATPEPPTVRFSLDPSRLFLTSPATGSGLDFTFVWTSEDAAKQFGTIRLERGSFMIRPGEPVFVIHHPAGRLKEASLDDTELLGINSTCLLYAADTEGGSSGACVFNSRGKLVALHHAFREGEDLKAKFPDARQDGREVSVANEGIKIAAIALDLEHRISQGGADARSAAEILRNIEGSDTLTGVFGGLGRAVDAQSDHGRVVELYGASDQDIDVGFWDLQWLKGSKDPDKLYDVATAITDLNLDAWCLIQVPADAVDGILAKLDEKFGEKFRFEFAEEEGQRLQLATAVIWRPSSVSLERGRWDASMNGAWTRPVRATGSPDPAKPVFAVEPALFHLRALKCPTEAAVNLVAVNSKALGQDELRRRLMSKFLAHGIGKAIAAGNGKDWIVGANSEPPLEPRDLTALGKGYAPYAANDEQRGGAFSYLRSENSPIDRIFVTGDLSPSEERQRFFHVAKDRTVDKFIRKIADNRPVVMRLSLGGSKAATSERAVVETLQTVFGTPEFRLESGDGWATGLTSAGLTKPAFLSTNRAQFTRLRAEINARLTNQYGAGILPLSEADLWVIIFAEAGIKSGGFVDPEARHSLGERGLLPLPSNVTFWNGADAPRWDRLMPLATNLFHYALYLGQLKNKSVTTVGGRTLYRDLFRVAGIVDTAERQAKLLAGIVHGYFVRANYGGHPVPFDHILDGYSRDVPVDEILRGTRYVHAQTSIPANRERNIKAALDAFHASQP